MTYSQFRNEVQDWPVSNHFHNTMRIALTTGNRAKFDPEHLTKVDMRFLEKHGYELNINEMSVEV